jgi:long-chain fatty acid transport protein
MKRILMSFSLLFMVAISAHAQMDNLANMSAKWIRSNVRNAALDGGADMVNYNPAGLAILDDGIYLSFSNQMLFRSPQHAFNLGAGELSYEQDGSDPFLPMFYAAYKKNKLAVSTGVYVVGGGATVDYPSGSFNTNLIGNMMLPVMGGDYSSLDKQMLEASSYYLAVPLNFSYAISEKVAVSLGGRYIRGINNTKAGITFSGSNLAPDYALNIDYKSSATGYGAIVGVNYKANDKLNIAIHYESRVKLEFEVDDNSGNYELESDGTKSRRDLPAVLNTGLTYQLTSKLIAGADFNYYFQKGAEWGKMQHPETGQYVDASDAAGDCFTANLGFTYLLNDKWQLSAGGSFTNFMYDDMELYYTKMGLYEALKYDNLNIGLGAGYNITKNIMVDLGVARAFWQDKTIRSLHAGIPVSVTDKSYVAAIGVDIRF